jgi:HD-like signal output (HDOD) protein
MNEQELQERRKKTEKVLSNVSTLPSIPEVMFEVTKLLDDPMTSTTNLSKIIGKDQGLVTKILSIANSPLYGLSRRVSTVDYAIIILGNQEIKNMVIALSMMEAFKNKNDRVLNYKDFWVHSILTGAAARRLAVELKYENAGEAFVAGLLHDLGISVMHKYLHSSFMAIIELVKNEEMNFLEAEYDQLGLTHADIARHLAEQWNFPPSLCDAISFHHKPAECKVDKQLTALIHVADYMVNQVAPGNFFWDDFLTPDPFVCDVFQLDDISELNEYIEKYRPLLEDEIKTVWF